MLKAGHTLSVVGGGGEALTAGSGSDFSVAITTGREREREEGRKQEGGETG